MLNLMREMQEKINQLEGNQGQPKPLTPQLPPFAPLPPPSRNQSFASPSSSNLNTSYMALPPFATVFTTTTTKNQDLDCGRSVRKQNYGENDEEGMICSFIKEIV